ncbi:hypothetical protein V6M85_07620 [Sulfolobus tengchongensis]|uniref:ArnR1-like winged helix-turn-helix domain-containing protein n=1 Tax=Sulfolobus tengchongensis TaxID=207809 RepID=A0AAX4KWV4_9CREN
MKKLFGIFRMWTYQALTELSKGKKSVEELKKSLPLYGSAFDFTISVLLSTGLAKRSIEGGVEYLEITDLGKGYLTGIIDWHRGLHHRKGWW